MNRIARTALLLFALTLGASHSLAQAGKPAPKPPPVAENNSQAWKEFTSAGGRFAVLLPGLPSEGVRKIDTGLGQLEMHSIYLHSTADYSVVYSDYPQALEEPDRAKRAFDGGRDEGVSKVNGRVLEEKDFTLGTHPGRYIRVETGNGLTIRSKFIIVGNRFYNVAVFTSDKDAPASIVKSNEETAAKFLDSFRLLTDAEAEAVAQAAPRLSIPEGVTVDPEILESKGAPDEKPAEGEVDRLLKSLDEKGELVFGACKEFGKCPPLPNIDGVTAEEAKRGVIIKVISKPPPVYPPIAKAARAQGSVRVEVIVDEEGKVIAAQALNGFPLLQAAAVKAAREVRLAPVLLGTKPVKTLGVITYNFVLK